MTGSVAQVVMLFHFYASVSFKANKTEQGPTNKLSKGRQHTFISPPTYNILASWYLYFRFLRLIKCWRVSWFKGWNKPWNCDIVRDSRLLRLLSCLKCQYIPGYNKFTWGLQISSKMPSHPERSQNLAHILIMYYNSVLWTYYIVVPVSLLEWSRQRVNDK